MKNKTIKLYDNPLKHMPFRHENGELRWHSDLANNLRQGFEISINKWQIIVKEDPRIHIDGSINTCGLCHIYYQTKNCGDCPVAKTISPLCECTPYEDWCGNNIEKHARAELNFLIELAKKYGFEIEEVRDDK